MSGIDPNKPPRPGMRLVYSYSGDVYWEDEFHKPDRARYLRDERRCRYCWIIASQYEKHCEMCGAPL